MPSFSSRLKNILGLLSSEAARILFHLRQTLAFRKATMISHGQGVGKLQSKLVQSKIGLPLQALCVNLVGL